MCRLAHSACCLHVLDALITRCLGQRTIRPKIMKLLPKFLHPLNPVSVKKSSLDVKVRISGDADLTKPGAVAKFLSSFKGIDHSVSPVSEYFKGGATAAAKQLKEFIDNRIQYYGELRNEPVKKYCSDLSPWYHFGHLSPVHAAVAVMQSKAPKTGKEGFVEESVVRRELSLNLCHFEPKYDDFSCLPPWAKQTLQKHAKDKREHTYSYKQLESAKTDDEVWNAAQQEMVLTGKMSNYMRMYWGKKVLEWAPSHELAFKWLLALNNKYELDGRDPNSFAGVAWVFGNHDRPWQKTPVFGMVRYMGQRGMYAKFDMKGYIAMVAALENGGSASKAAGTGGLGAGGGAVKRKPAGASSAAAPRAKRVRKS